MKILSSEQIHLADAYTIGNEPIPSIQLMERAVEHLLPVLLELPVFKESGKKPLLFCGMGNNGGDGLALARLLFIHGFRPQVCIVRHRTVPSDDFLVNEGRLKEIQEIPILYIEKIEDFSKIPDSKLAIDALLGTGLTDSVHGLLAEAIQYINRLESIVVSVDMPSGLFADKSSAAINSSAIIQADYTFSFEFPKLAFMFAENAKYVGDWKVISIGLHQGYVDDLPVKYSFLEAQMFKKWLKWRGKFDHKGKYGHAFIVAGSRGKMGAAILASQACLKSGAGMLTSHVPSCGELPLHISIPEAMLQVDQNLDFIADALQFSFADAGGIGPGIGKNEETAKVLKWLIQEVKVPLVLDADALNILAENKTWISFLPPGSILTPHPLEFERLCGKATDDFDRLEKQIEFSIKYQVYVVLKGANTSITCPNGYTYFNSTGNPGMATAGSGDVLTGILTGLLARGYSNEQACLLGVYLHGLAGDWAAKNLGMESMLAGDIVHNLSAALIQLHSEVFV